MEDNIVEKKEDIKDLLDLSSFKYGGLTLNAWIKFLSIDLPALPANSLDIGKTIVELNSKYQIAYNNLSLLEAQCSSAQRKYVSMRDKLIETYISSLSSKGVNKYPAKETLEALVLSNKDNNNLRSLHNKYEIYCIVKDFFENHKNKLEKVMKLASDLSYLINASDKMNFKGLS
jgi:hypothetical protein